MGKYTGCLEVNMEKYMNALTAKTIDDYRNEYQQSLEFFEIYELN